MLLFGTVNAGRREKGEMALLKISWRFRTDIQKQTPENMILLDV